MFTQPSNSSTSIGGMFADMNGQQPCQTATQQQPVPPSRSSSRAKRTASEMAIDNLDESDYDDDNISPDDDNSPNDTTTNKFPTPFELLPNWPSMGSGKHTITSAKHDFWIYCLTATISDLKSKFKVLKRESDESLTSLINRVNQLDNENIEKTRIIGELNNKINELEKNKPVTDNILAEIKSAAQDAVSQLPKPSTFADIVSYGLDKSRTNLEVDIVYATNKELVEKEKRASNLIIFGLPHNNNDQVDKNNINSLLNIIQVGQNAVKNTLRLKTNVNTRPPPVLVELVNSSERKKALENARNLKNHSEYTSVSISPDMTVAERLVKKKLLEKCRSMNNERPTNPQFVYRIRNNAITMINIATNRIFKPNGSSRSTTTT